MVLSYEMSHVNLQLLNPQIYLKNSIGLWRLDQPFSFSRNLLGTGWSGGHNVRKSSNITVPAAKHEVHMGADGRRHCPCLQLKGHRSFSK